MIVYSYKITLLHLSHIYGSTSLFTKNYTTIDDFEIDVKAKLLCNNGNGTIRLIDHLNKYRKDISSKTDFEIYLIKIIKEKVEIAIKFEMLKNDLITIEKYQAS